jgi:hypothetical protein
MEGRKVAWHAGITDAGTSLRSIEMQIRHIGVLIPNERLSPHRDRSRGIQPNDHRDIALPY